MNGIHDMGGMHGMGPVRPEENEPVFHEEWEGRIYAINRAIGAWKKWNIDAGRHAIEQIPPADYLRMSYYEIWFASLVKALIDNGWVTAREVEHGRSERAATNGAVPASRAEIIAAGFKPADNPGKETEAPRFVVGAPVRALNINPTTHTRLPQYARGKIGTIARQYGLANFPDTDEYNLGANPNHVYSVRFPARELWGSGAVAKDFIYVDLWERYLEPA